MPATRPANPRKGDQAEYLAQYLLSSLGLVIPVPRQEDTGMDFHCTIADQEQGSLTFDFPYMIQIKKSSVAALSYGGLDKKKKWKKEQIEWLFRQNVPLLIGIIEATRGKNKLSIFCPTTAWFVYYDHPNATKITLNYNLAHDGSKVGRPVERAIQGKKSNCGNGMEYFCDMGPAIASITVDDVLDDPHLALIKKKIRAVVTLEQQNIVYRRLGVPYFQWLWDFNNGRAGYMYPDRVANEHISKDYCNILLASAILFKKQKKRKKFSRTKELILTFPRDMFPEINPDNSPDMKAALVAIFGK